MEQFLHYGSVERVPTSWKREGLYRAGWPHRVPQKILHHGSPEGCTKDVGCNKNHKRLLCRGSVEKFLHRRRVEGCIELVGNVEYHKRFLCRGCTEGCVELVGCIEYHKLAASSTIKDSYAKEAWSNFYTVEVWKRFLRCGSAKGCTELVGRIEYHKRFLCPGSGEVPTPWKYGKLYRVSWPHQV